MVVIKQSGTIERGMDGDGARNLLAYAVRDCCNLHLGSHNVPKKRI